MVLKPPPTPVRPAFTAATLVGLIRETLCGLPDKRKGGNNQCYAMGDAGLSAFSVFFLQSPSFLDYQRRMQKERGRNNASSLFGVHQIPSTQQIGNLLDPVAPAHLAPVFVDLVGALEDAGELASHRVLDGRLLVALDAEETRALLQEVPRLARTQIQEALVAALDAWKGGATRDALLARTPPVVFADDALARGHKLIEYKFEGEPKVVGTGITYVLSLTTQDGTKPPATRKLAYRVVTSPNVAISKEDSMP